VDAEADATGCGAVDAALHAGGAFGEAAGVELKTAPSGERAHAVEVMEAKPVGEVELVVEIGFAELRDEEGGSGLGRDLRPDSVEHGVREAFGKLDGADSLQGAGGGAAEEGDGGTQDAALVSGGGGDDAEPGSAAEAATEVCIVRPWTHGEVIIADDADGLTDGLADGGGEGAPVDAGRIGAGEPLQAEGEVGWAWCPRARWRWSRRGRRGEGLEPVIPGGGGRELGRPRG